MQTYSHLIITAALIKPVEKAARAHPETVPPVAAGALLLGSVLPDIPLIVLSIITVARDVVTGAFNRIDFASLPPGQPPPAEWLEISLTMRLFERWFFENPFVIAVHNLFHSPTLVAVFLAASYCGWRRRWAGSRWFFWLSGAAMLHTLLDIPLHVTDGPLLFFPFNWTIRFRAPISYWDPNYFGREWFIFEHILNAVLLIYLAARYARPFFSWIKGRMGNAEPAPVGGEN